MEPGCREHSMGGLAMYEPGARGEAQLGSESPVHHLPYASFLGERDHQHE